MNTSTRPSGYINRLSAFIVVCGLLAFAPQAQGQTPYKILAGSHINVSGTSNLHDWTMQASTFTCEGNLTLKNGQLSDINALQFTLPVTNLKSKEDLMDTRTYKALKANEHSKITFKLTAATVVPQQKIINTTGYLTIAGITKQVSLQTSYIVNADETITCKGSESINMSDYGIKAPSFMMGALKTGNTVVIDLLIKLKKESQIIQ
jgi:polyisoprenoid-binding protein YceI